MNISRVWIFAGLPVIVFVILNLISQGFYTYRSLGLREDKGTAFSEVPEISTLDFDGNLKRISSEVPKGVDTVISDTGNVVLAKILGIYFENKTIAFPSTDFWRIGTYNPEQQTQLVALRDKGIERVGERLSNQRQSHLIPAEFPLPNGGNPDPFIAESFQTDIPGPKMLLTTSSRQSVLNRFTDDGSDESFYLKPFDQVRNHAVFVDSGLGHSYVYGKDPETFFQLEPDYFYPNSRMVGIGRYLLLRIENPSPTVRIVFALTTSLNGDQRNENIPPISVLGESRVSMNAIGSGSARLLSDPVVPRKIKGGAYVLLDMGRQASLFQRRNYGYLFNLYNHVILLDHRKLNGFARDISVVDDAQIKALDVPSEMTLDTESLARREFFYSGIYEDGWISGDSSFRLESHAGDRALHIQGFVPLIADPTFQTTMTVSIDGKTAVKRTLPLGNFDVAAPVNPSGARHAVAIHFSNIQNLPGGDGRPVGAKVARFGFATQ